MTLKSYVNSLNNTNKQHTQIIANNSRSIKIGTITGYDPNNYAVSVDFKPYDDNQIPQTSWIPIASLHAGTNRGVFTPPQVGDQAVVAFGDGTYQSGVLIGYIFSDVDRAPNVPAGTFLLQIGNGTDVSTIEINEDGSLKIKSSQSVTVIAPSTIIKSDGGTPGFLTKFEELKAAYDAHTHSTPSGESSPPTQPLSSDVATTVVQGE